MPESRKTRQPYLTSLGLLHNVQGLELHPPNSPGQAPGFFLRSGNPLLGYIRFVNTAQLSTISVETLPYRNCLQMAWVFRHNWTEPQECGLQNRGRGLQ